MTLIEFDSSYLEKLVPLFDEYRDFYGATAEPGSTYAFLKGIFERGDATCFLAIDDDASVLGFANLYPCYSSLSLQRLWILNDLFVASAARGKGVSKALIDHVLSFAKQTGAVRVELKTDRPNTRAQNLYRSIGFVPDEDNVYYRVPV